MAKKLQLVIEANIDNDADYDVEITPGSIKIPEEAEMGVQILVASADLFDTDGGEIDGDIDFQDKLKLPIIKIFGKKFSYTIPIKATLQIVDVIED